MQLQLQHLGNLEIAASSRNLETDPVSSVRQWVRNISFEVAHGPVMAWALPKILPGWSGENAAGYALEAML